jgi:hypothetical protein
MSDALENALSAETPLQTRNPVLNAVSNAFNAVRSSEILKGGIIGSCCGAAMTLGFAAVTGDISNIAALSATGAAAATGVVHGALHTVADHGYEGFAKAAEHNRLVNYIRERGQSLQAQPALATSQASTAPRNGSAVTPPPSSAFQFDGETPDNPMVRSIIEQAELRRGSASSKAAQLQAESVQGAQRGI